MALISSTTDAARFVAQIRCDNSACCVASSIMKES
jgi:hypothetical protein